MNQKQREAALKAHPKRKSWRMWILLVVAVIAVIVVFTLNRDTEVPQQLPSSEPSSTVNSQGSGEMYLEVRGKDGRLMISSPESENVKLINDLLDAIRPERVENDFMTPFMKERISWAFAEIAANRLELRPYAGYFTTPEGVTNDGTFMATNYDSEKRVSYINLSVARLLVYTKIQCGVPSGFNERIKIQFALIIVHEATHLERPTEFYVDPRTPADTFAEEVRTWAKVSTEAVRALRKAGKPVESDLIEADDILKRCHDDTSCSEFQAFVRTKM